MATPIKNPDMRSYRHHAHQVYANDVWPRWLAIFDLQWKPLQVERLEPDADMVASMRAALARLEGEGWEIEAPPRFGFSFIRRDGVRRLLTLTPRDPFDDKPTSFNPFK